MHNDLFVNLHYTTHMPMSAQQVQSALHAIATPAKAKASAWFFKTGKGQYGYGDKFRGITVPEQRKLAKQFKTLSLPEITKLLKSPWHEDRLTALLILDLQFQKGDPATQKKIYQFYLKNLKTVNNWDLVDSSASYIVGQYLLNTNSSTIILQKLVKSKVLWERRVGIIATHAFIRAGDPKPTIQIAPLLLKDKEDLMHKAVGWMLREVGKGCSMEVLRDFLKLYAATLPRTALRYAIEHMSQAEKQRWMALGKAKA